MPTEPTPPAPADADDGGENSPQNRRGLPRTTPKAGRKGADESLAVALASGRTVSEAASASGVSETTAYRRQRDPEFAARVRELRAQMVSAAAGKLADGMASAADVLRDLLTSESETVRLRAADRLLEIGVKVVELQELQQRVEDLEHRLAGK